MKAKTILSGIYFGSVVAMAGCATTTSQTEVVEPGMSRLGTVLTFNEKEPGTEAGSVVMFVNEDFLRIDEGASRDDFVLFDRKAQTIFNVNSRDKTILTIAGRAIDVKPPIAIDYTEEKQESGALMRGSGTQSYHYKYSANSKVCYNVVAVDGFLPRVVSALSEFRRVLAGEHAKTLAEIPADQVDACDLALNIFHATRHLEHGFAVREWDTKGYQRFLVDFKDGVTVESARLTLPEGYTRYSIDASPQKASAKK